MGLGVDRETNAVVEAFDQFLSCQSPDKAPSRKISNVAHRIPKVFPGIFLAVE